MDGARVVTASDGCPTKSPRVTKLSYEGRYYQITEIQRLQAPLACAGSAPPRNTTDSDFVTTFQGNVATCRRRPASGLGRAPLTWVAKAQLRSRDSGYEHPGDALCGWTCCIGMFARALGIRGGLACLGGNLGAMQLYHAGGVGGAEVIWGWGPSPS